MATRQPKKRSKSGSGRLRIVAGNWRGRRLPVPDLPGLRPTPERVRETLYNWLMHWIPKKHCLDLYAGTGALGFEALSRGAASCTFVERNPEACRLLRQNAATLGAPNATVLQGDAISQLGSLPRDSVDLVFLDPPFDDSNISDLCRRLEQSGILKAGARVYAEQDRGAGPIELPPVWATCKTGKAGKVSYSLLTTGPAAHNNE